MNIRPLEMDGLQLCEACKSLAGAGWRTEPHQFLEQTAKPPPEAVDAKALTRYRCTACEGAWQLEAGTNGRGWFPSTSQP